MMELSDWGSAFLLATALACGEKGTASEAQEPAVGGSSSESGDAPSGGASLGGSSAGSGGTASGGALAVGGRSSDAGGAPSVGGAGSGGSAGSGDPCEEAALIWRSARKTNYTSYPDPGSEECIEYNGCEWAGWFAGCTDQQSEEWVEATNIVALFPNFDQYDGHQICIRSGEQTMIVNVIDTCGDSDCSGCCTENRGDSDALVDLESFTNQRWGLSDGIIEWADLGPKPAPVCD